VKNKQKDPDNSPLPKTPNNLFVDAVFASIGEGAIATDELSRIVRINKRALDILGLEERDVLGKWYPATIVAVKEDGTIINPMERSITKAFITGDSITENSYYIASDNTKIPVTITVSPIILDGRPVGAINLFRDITQENEIDHIKSEFISLASHQLRTPLSSIKAYSHMILDGYMGSINSDQKFALSAIVDASDRMNQLTDTLLNITRIESGSVVISKKALDFNALVDKTLIEHAVDAELKNIALLSRGSAKPLLVNTDKFVVKEILANLVSNAVKYTPKGGRVRVHYKVTKEEVVCCVTDTGMGIPKQSQSKIFEKFYRAPNVIDRDTTGTGLGLYLIKSLAERINMPLWFKSEEGKGSTFCFSMPVASANGKIAQKKSAYSKEIKENS
jgi:PAS domain S-box-containing protein